MIANSRRCRCGTSRSFAGEERRCGHSRTSRSELCARRPLTHREQSGFILNLASHWFTLRRFGYSTRWYNLNSFLPEPQWISPTYLDMVLKQAEAEGYSVFVVRQAGPGAGEEAVEDPGEGKGWQDSGVGVMPESAADAMALELGEVKRRGGFVSAQEMATSVAGRECCTAVHADYKLLGARRLIRMTSLLLALAGADAGRRISCPTRWRSRTCCLAADRQEGARPSRLVATSPGLGWTTTTKSSTTKQNTSLLRLSPRTFSTPTARTTTRTKHSRLHFGLAWKMRPRTMLCLSCHRRTRSQFPVLRGARLRPQPCLRRSPMRLHLRQPRLPSLPTR